MLARHPHCTLHFTPTSASWLNAVETLLPSSPEGDSFAASSDPSAISRPPSTASSWKPMPKQSPSSGPQIQPRPRRCQTQETSVRVDPLANEPWPPLFGLRDGLGGVGYIEKQNLDLVYRFVEGQSGRYAALAGDLVRLPVDVTVTWGTPASLAAKEASSGGSDCLLI